MVGWPPDLSKAVTDRALFHLDNAYTIPAVEFRGQVAKNEFVQQTQHFADSAGRWYAGPLKKILIALRATFVSRP